MSFLSGHKIIIAIAAIIVAAGIWYALSDSSAPAPASLVTTENGGEVGGSSNRQLIATLLALRAVKLEGSIFSDPAFQGLKDFSTEIIPEPVGRPNPFAPLASSTPSSNPARGAQI